MARSPAVDRYIASRPEATRRALERVRRTLHEVLPAAEEVISYQMPALRLHGRIVLHFAGWTSHCALYPGARIVETLKKELRPYGISKGTIRFPLSAPAPAALVARIARLRAKEVAARERARTRTRKAAPVKRERVSSAPRASAVPYRRRSP
jgi:uncharacterized protein YdhG (YjbR/CyaY superfamily)